MSLLNFEINVVAYCKADLVNAFIASIRDSGAAGLPIRVWDNSPTPLQIQGADDVRWNRFNPSLTRVWNWAIAQSETDWVLVSNDDIKFKPSWYKSLCEEVEANPTALWFGPSRCFLFSKLLLNTVGWFDERMTGITWEDLDYVRRMNHAGVNKVYGNASCLSTLAENLKGTAGREPLRPYINEDFFKTKYSNHDTEDFTGTPNFDTPDWYPHRAL